VAARTGGLADTIIDANEAALSGGVATGYLFDGVTRANLTRAIARVLDGFSRPKVWRALKRQGMRCDFSWSHSAQRYADLYQSLVKRNP